MAVITDAITAPRLGTRARLVLVLLCAAQFAMSIDFSILNVALPSIGRDLGLAEANLQWAVTAFALPSGGFLLLAGRLGDLVGRRRMFLVGLGLFAAASLVATVAVSPAMLLTGRAIQGVGAAITIPTAMALLTTTFPEGPARTRALGISGVVLSLGFTIGMLLGGVLTSAFGWRSTMALNVIMAVPVLVAAPLLLAESRPDERPRLDVPGAVTVTGGLLALIYALSTAAEHGWTRPDVPVTLAAAVLLLAAFAIVETRAAQPLVSLRVLGRRTVALGNLGGMTTFSMASSVVFLVTLYLQQVRGLSALSTGLIFGVSGLVTAGSGMLASRLINRLGSRTTVVGGLALQAVGTVLLLALGTHGPGVLVSLVACSVAFAGHMQVVVGYGVTATSGLTNTEQGLATGLVTTAQQVGITIGIPILSAVYAAHTATLRAAGRPALPAMLAGIHLSLALDTAAVAAVALAIALTLRQHRHSSA